MQPRRCETGDISGFKAMTIYQADRSDRVYPQREVRMHRTPAIVFFCLYCVVFVSAQKKVEPAKVSGTEPRAAAATESSRLPVKRVVLYKNGVGYFEHSARVHGNQELAIDFTTAQLNDVLK